VLATVTDAPRWHSRCVPLICAAALASLVISLPPSTHTTTALAESHAACVRCAMPAAFDLTLMPDLITTPSTPPSRLEELRTRYATVKRAHATADAREDEYGEAIPFAILRELSRAKALLRAEESRLAKR